MLHQQSAEILGALHEPVFGPAVQVDVRQFLARHLQDKFEWIVRRALLGRSEDLSLGASLHLPAKALHADARVDGRGGRTPGPLRFARFELLAVRLCKGDGPAVAADGTKE